MSDSEILPLLKAVERLHDCVANFIGKEYVKEEFEGEIVWEGNVYKFELLEHPSANLAYAWSSMIDNSEKRKFYAVLKKSLSNLLQTRLKQA